jgi:hypothetical protein
VASRGVGGRAGSIIEAAQIGACRGFGRLDESSRDPLLLAQMAARQAVARVAH